MPPAKKPQPPQPAGRALTHSGHVLEPMPRSAAKPATNTKKTAASTRKTGRK
jgi:hypothetical protein